MIAILTFGVLAEPAVPASLVINEIYFQPPDKRPVEFIELYNPTTERLSLTGWSLNTYRFASNTVVEAGAFVVLALEPAAFEKEFGFKPIGLFREKLKHSGTTLRLRDPQGKIVDEVHYGVGFPWPTATGGAGSSLERVNPALPGNSPDSWRSSGFPDGSARRAQPAGPRARPSAAIEKWQRPTPGLPNSTFSAAPAASILKVEHQPERPKSGQPVRITLVTNNLDQPTNVTLSVQIVEPGSYVGLADKAYATGWRDFSMSPSPTQSGVFTATVPGDFQKHRRLLRYRLTITGEGKRAVRLPYADDEVPNFAWFVYDGLPNWTGANRPGQTTPKTFPGEMLSTLPVYHLLASEPDVSHSQWDGAYNRQPFFGTLVYDGQVYDHIRFHNRGQASTYLAGKNKWAFKFNRGHSFTARDNYGRAYLNRWHSLDLNACASPWVQMNRGMAGMDEALAFRSYQLAGVPAANTHWVHFRVIDRAEEASTENQYRGDLWGLYLAIQPMEGPWLDELGLPSGNVYSLQGGRKYLSRGMPADNSDWQQFRGAIERRQSESWWRRHLDLPAFYSFQALNRLLSNVDLREDANHGYYHAPDGRWAPIPWDNDMMFIPHSHQSGRIEAENCLDSPGLRLEFKNRAREILDLFASDPSPNGGQFAQLVNELARILCPPGKSPTWPELDMAMWNFHPRSHTKGEFYVNPYTKGWSGLPFRRELPTPDFSGFCRYIVNYCTDSRPEKNYQPDDNNPVGYGWGYLSWEARDEKIPQTPLIKYAGQNGFLVTNLAFSISPFVGLGQAKFTAVQWRVGEIRAPGLGGYQAGQPYAYELTPAWLSQQLTNQDSVFRLPANACQVGRTYRVRARYKDTSGRCSHWSLPVQFVAASPTLP